MKEKEFQETLAELIKRRDTAMEKKLDGRIWLRDWSRLTRCASTDQLRRANELLELHDSNSISQLNMRFA